MVTLSDRAHILIDIMKSLYSADSDSSRYVSIIFLTWTMKLYIPSLYNNENLSVEYREDKSSFGSTPERIVNLRSICVYILRGCTYCANSINIALINPIMTSSSTIVSKTSTL